MLNGSGGATAFVSFSPGSTSTLAGLRIHTAFVALDGSTGIAEFASNPEALDFLP